MTDDGRPEPKSTPEPERPLSARDRAERARRLAEVFGDALPEQTSDDLDDERASTNDDDRLRREVPPHHG